MIDLGALYLKNLAKRAATGEHVYPVEIVKLPQVIDKVYGDGNGTLDMSDIDDIATNVTEEIVDKAEHIWDIGTSVVSTVLDWF